MIPKKVMRLIALGALSCLMTNIRVVAQSTSVLATGLKTPVKIVLTDSGNLLVAEAGSGPNTGRISRLDRCGNRLTLLDALPSGLSFPNSVPDGPTAVALLGRRTLYVLIGDGDSLSLSGAPNPNPSSPILSSVLVVEFGTEVDQSAGGFTLPFANHATLKKGMTLNLSNAQGETAAVRLLVDFPDIVTIPASTDVLQSHPFAAELDGNQLYIADAGFNSVVKVDINTGASSVVANFPPLPNPLSIGPPVMQAVPEGLRLFGGGLLVPLLPGFPFPVGGSQVRRVELATGSITTFITGLTTAIDVLGVKTRLGADQFYVLEFTDNLLAQQPGPGRLLRFDSPAGPPAVIVSNLITPVGMARDAKSGDIFVSEIFTGRVIQVLGNEFDVCLQDDDTNDVLRFNSLTGDYLFVSCAAGVTLTGRGRIVRGGCALELRDSRVVAAVERCPFSPLSRGSATIRRSPFSRIFINDSNTANNTCTGR